MSYTDVKPDELAELSTIPNLIIIDQRDEATRLAGKLDGSVAASDEVISQLLRQRRKDPPVLIYCYHGNQSRDLCDFVTQLGLTRVYNLEGGWEAFLKWQASQGDKKDRFDDWLIAHGFEPDNMNSRVKMGMTALMQASLEGDIALVQHLLNCGANPNPINDDEHHALWFACVNGNIELIKLLIKAGADINNRNINGVTCAIYAASTGKLEVLKTLVANGADMQIRTHDGYDALDSASSLGVLRYLRPLCQTEAMH